MLNSCAQVTTFGEVRASKHMRTPQRMVPLSPHNCEPLVPGEEVVLRGGILAAAHLYDIRSELFLACEKLPEMLVVLQRFD